MCGAGGKNTGHLVAAQPWWANPQARLFLQRLMEEKQQPDMTHLLQSRYRLAGIERWQQLQYAARGGGQLRLAWNGKFLSEAGAQNANGADCVMHGDGRQKKSSDDSADNVSVLCDMVLERPRTSRT